jgi:aldose 1-epimerase
VDTLLLRVPARTVLLSNERGISSESLVVDGTYWDFREFSMIGDLKLDHAFTDLLRNDKNQTEVCLADPPSGQSVRLWVDAAYTHLMVFTGDTLASGARRGLAVEPMTCPPNAFRTGEGVVRLEPGQTVTSRWGIRPG